MTIASRSTRVTAPHRATADPGGRNEPVAADVDRVELAILAEAVEADGVAAHPTGVLRLAEVARRHGASRTVLEVLLDSREPEAARLRAFAVAARCLLRAD